MVAAIVYNNQKASFWRTTWAELKETKKVWGPWLATFTVVIFVIGFAISIVPLPAGITQADLKKHPELVGEFLKQMMPYWGPFIIVYLALRVIGVYLFGVAYLRSAMPKAPPQYSVDGFVFWFKKTFVKYIRPLVWVLIPLVGIFLYYRSILRYQLVTPMAIMRREPTLQRSWDLTENNVWRIFRGVFALNFCLTIIIFLIFIIPLMVTGIIAHHDPQSIIYRLVNSFYSGFSASLLIIANTVYACTVYRILLTEQKGQTSTDTPAL